MQTLELAETLCQEKRNWSVGASKKQIVTQIRRLLSHEKILLKAFPLSRKD
jgi:hypothetical protein